MAVRPGLTDWLTAIGTLAVAVAAVGVAFFAEWRAGVRVAAERTHSAKVLANERAAADARLRVQQELSDAQLRRERDLAREQEQLAEAWAVEVIPKVSMDSQTCSLGADVTNLCSFTITRVEARFSPDGKSLVPHEQAERLHELDAGAFGGLHASFSLSGYQGILTRGTAIRFWSDRLDRAVMADPYPVVRWTDRWGQRWQHRKGDVFRIDESEPWSP